MMKKSITLLAAALVMTLGSCSASAEKKAADAAAADTVAAADTIPNVYYIKDITPENIVKIYNALGRKATGKVGVKISTGESMKSNQLNPQLIAPIVNLVDGTLIECNTAYPGNRNTTEKHLKAVEEHGYTAIAKVDIMDSEGDTAIIVPGGKHLDVDIVGRHFLDYDFIVVLSHFKGHQMGGFGGALKNISIGIASSGGKAYIHTAGKTNVPDSLWANLPEQDAFLESMADACKAIINHTGKNILYINIANNVSIDCDCNGNPKAPEMKDFGILASLDPVALDRACVDMVINSDDSGKQSLIDRINEMHGTHILTAAEELGLGSQKYNLITIEE